MIRRLKALLRWGDRSPRARQHRLFCLACVVLIFLCAAYVINYYAQRESTRQRGEIYRAMYSPAPIATHGAAFFAQDTETPAPTPAATPAPTEAPAPTLTATPAPTEAPAPTLTATPTPTETPAPTVVDETLPPLSTPDADTLIYALPTPGAPQESFAQLLEHNPDTVAYLKIGEIVDLPVVQRENDNEYYLNHNFSGEEAREGALFLDGMNRFGDANLIVYGHNMRDGTMYGQKDFLVENALVRFDTLYENALYVPFAMFEASMNESDAHYFDVRTIAFDESSFDLYVLRMRNRSELQIPLDVAYGDELLTLVTCSYGDDDGRYIVALRKMRDGETEEDIRALMAQVA